VILLDVMMPGIDGFETCRQLKADESTKGIPVIFISALDELNATVEWFRAGGVDYLTKPFQAEEVLIRVHTHLTNAQLTRELRKTNEELVAEIARREKAESDRDQADGQLSVFAERETTHWGVAGFIGRSETFKSILQSISRLNQFSSASVLVTGESGTGKELVARAVHFGGNQSKGPFIPVNCSAVPDELAESLFFGHLKGSFTGAVSDRKGYFELANGGTLFLDEIGEMPLTLQSKLLRVLEDGEIRPVGADKSIRVNARIIAASNVDFQQAVQDGRFRKDLFFRLARFTIELPPLRERLDDVPLLANHFLRLFSGEMNIPTPELDRETLDRLKNYSYPGNVRELKNMLERAMIECDGKAIGVGHLHFFRPDALPAIDETNENDQEESPGEGQQDDESLVINYLKEQGIINNTVCRQLLNIDRNRSSYLLRKLEKQGTLVSEGNGRWAQYRLKENCDGAG